MTFKLTIDCGNAAFVSDDGTPWPAPEVARILREAADSVEAENTYDDLHDINGNKVGSFEFRK
jgi:hypothetical protein